MQQLVVPQLVPLVDQLYEDPHPPMADYLMLALSESGLNRCGDSHTDWCYAVKEMPPRASDLAGFASTDDIRSESIAAVCQQMQALGVLTVDSHSPGTFTVDQRALRVQLNRLRPLYLALKGELMMAGATLRQHLSVR